MAILNTIVVVLISLLLIAGIIGLILGIVLLVIGVGEKDAKKKSRYLIGAVVSLVGPALLLFVTISIWGLISVINK